MEQSTLTEHGESAEAPGDMSAMSPIKKSRRKGSSDIDLSTRLRILQQAAFDYKSAGGETSIISYQGEHGKTNTVIILECIVVNEHGNFAPDPHGKPG